VEAVNMWQALVGPLLSLGKQWLTNKSEEKQATHEAKLKRIAQEADWEQTMAKGSLSSWKDEWFTVVLSVPVVAVGFGIALDSPTVLERTKEALDALSGLPEWYQYLLYVAVLSSFGIRGVDKLMELRR